MSEAIGFFIGITIYSLLILYLFIRNCLWVDEAVKYNYNEKKMYKYQGWMFFIFRYRWDTSGDAYKSKIKILDENNAEHISKLSFWLQIFFILLFIAAIVTLGLISNAIGLTEYARLMYTVVWAEMGVAGVFWLLVFIYYGIKTERAIKRFKAKEAQDNAILQQPAQTEAPLVEETLPDQSRSTASDSDNYNPYLQ